MEAFVLSRYGTRVGGMIAALALVVTVLAPAGVALGESLGDTATVDVSEDGFYARVMLNMGEDVNASIETQATSRGSHTETVSPISRSSSTFGSPSESFEEDQPSEAAGADEETSTPAEAEEAGESEAAPETESEEAPERRDGLATLPAVRDVTRVVEDPEPTGLVERVRAALTRAVDDVKARLALDDDAAPAPDQARATGASTGRGVAGPVHADEVSPVTAVAVLTVVGAAAVGWATGGGSALLALVKRALGVLGVGGFTRLGKGEVLDHDARQTLLAHVQENPGASLTALLDVTGLRRSTVTYHLRVLEREGLVTSSRQGRRRLYFPNGARGPGPKEAAAFATLKHEKTREIAEAVSARPGMDQSAICEACDVKPSLAYWHARRLEEAGLLRRERDGRRVRYYPGPLASAFLQRA